MIKTNDHIILKGINFLVNKKFFFKNLSANLSVKGITIILGPNGSGKSLLIRILRGLIQAQDGEISIKLNNQRPNIGYLSQNITFLRRNVFRNLSYPMEIKGYDRNYINDRITSLLKYFHFLGKENISARMLSKGNKQYLSFIRTLVTQPNLLILDEPSSNLDMESTKRIEKFLLKQKKNMKIIMVTHDLFQAKRLADEILFINEGKIIEISKKDKFLRSSNRLIKKFLEGNLF